VENLARPSHPLPERIPGGRDIRAEARERKQLLKQQLATDSARAQQACLLGSFRPRDELADPEFLISISSGESNV